MMKLCLVLWLSISLLDCCLAENAECSAYDIEQMDKLSEPIYKLSVEMRDRVLRIKGLRPTGTGHYCADVDKATQSSIASLESRITEKLEHLESILERNQADECASNPCQNRGICIDAVNGYNCQCTPGFGGAHCQNRDECASNPCQNRGICIDAGNGYNCQCTPGFSGAHCQNRVNLALGKSTTESTQMLNGYSSNAVDGHVGGPCSHTGEHDMIPWWRVDLGDIYTVSSLQIVNRVDYGERLNNFEIRVMNLPNASGSLCFHHVGAVAGGATITINCNPPVTGRHVLIKKAHPVAANPNHYLTLCEVRIFV